jgi:chromatin remodeling complex protein RSC6
MDQTKQVIENQPERIDINLQFAAINQTISTVKTNLTDLQQQLKILEKNVKKPLKETKESKSTKESKNIVFDTLQEIKPELSQFMKLPTTEDGKHVTISTRNIVTKYITDYIQTHKLQDMNNRKYIHLNEELALLFKLEAKEKITYFNIHKYINKLFI